MNRSDLHRYQEFNVRHIVDNKSVTLAGGAGLLLEMGLGKTISTLTAIVELFERGEIKKVLVIAPKRVADHTWSSEIAEWDHVRHLTYAICTGTEKQRKAALRQDVQIYIINRELVAWLVTYFGARWPFDMVVIDELSSFKNHQAIRFKALKQVRSKINRTVGLTGTPAPNSLIDLWAPMYLLDKGERLGKTITNYRNKYFTEGRSNGHVVYNYDIKQEFDELLGPDINQAEIYDKISDICVSMKARDWLNLPPLIDTTHTVYMPKELKKRYRQFERDAVLEIADQDENILALSAAGLRNKLLQFSNGAVYREDRSFYEVHDLKLEALEDCIEAAGSGNSVLVFYNYKSDVERMCGKLKHLNPHVLRNGKAGAEDIDAWNRKEIPFLIAHPASAGHGLNMQKGGNHVIWYGLPDSLELYQQAVARLDRQGQKVSVVNTHIVCEGTFDEDVVKGLIRKAWGQEQLMQAVKARVELYAA